MRYTWHDDAIHVDGELLATIDQEFWRDRAEIVIAGTPWRFVGGRSQMVAEHAGAPIMTAESMGFWSSGWSLRLPTTTCELRRPGIFGTTWEATDGDRLVATIASTSAWRYLPELTTDTLAAEEAVFTCWVVRRIVQRSAAVSAAQ